MLLKLQIFSIPSWFLPSSSLHWFLIGFCPCPVRLSTDVICLPIHPGFSLNVFPDAFKNWPHKPRISAASAFLSVWRLLCFAEHRLQEHSDSAVFYFQHCSLQLPRQPQALCGGLFIPTAPHAPHTLVCARSSVPGIVTVLIWRSCQGFSLLLTTWKVLHHSLLTTFCIFHIQNRLIWWVLLFFLPCFDFFPPISASKKNSITVRIDFSLNITRTAC